MGLKLGIDQEFDQAKGEISGLKLRYFKADMK